MGWRRPSLAPSLALPSSLQLSPCRDLHLKRSRVERRRLGGWVGQEGREEATKGVGLFQARRQAGKRVMRSWLWRGLLERGITGKWLKLGVLLLTSPSLAESNPGNYWSCF